MTRCPECRHLWIEHCEDCASPGCQVDTPDIDGSWEMCGCLEKENDHADES